MSSRAIRRVAIGVLLLAAGAGALWWRASAPHPPPGHGVQATLSVREALEGGAGFARATAPRPLTFPEDHGPHPSFRTEWWYYTGHLVTAAGRHFGFQLTFFRVALAPPAEAGAGENRRSAWATRQMAFAHFAVTDTVGHRFHASGRLSRQALDLAGARAQPFRVWVEDWSVEGEGVDGFPMRLRAADGGTAIDLRLSRGKPVVLQGDRGLSGKGPEPGNASYYYSYTRMPARGSLRLGAESYTVAGEAWMDREWSTSALGRDLSGWDWFAIQLDDGREVMLYRLRRHDGAVAPFSGGSLVAADGTARPLTADEATIDVLAHWTSPRSGVRYPARWRVGVPSAGIDADVVPLLADQELVVVGTRYWEGAVTVRGRGPDRPLSGKGYVELVGYGE